MKTYSFEKLDVWQRTRSLIKIIYEDTSSFPKEELFGLVSQLRRAAVSISSNIAEGSGSITSKEQANFYKIAYSSMLEVLSQLIVSADLGYIKMEKVDQVYRPIIERISFQLNALRKTTISKV